MKRRYEATTTLLQKKFNVDAHYFISGGFWLGLAQVVALGGSLVTSVLLAHFLTTEEFGIYRYLVSLFAFFTIFSLTGLGQSIIQTAAKKYYNFYHETLRTNFYYTSGTFASALAVATYYFYKENIVLAVGCVLIALVTPFITTFGNVTFFQYGTQQYQLNTQTQAIRTTFITLATIISLVVTSNILILFATYLLSSAISNICIHLLYRPRQFDPTPSNLLIHYKSFAFHTSIRNVIASAANQIDTLFIFTQLGSAELATYAIATLVPEQIKSSFKNLANLLLPKYAQHQDMDILRKSVFKRSWQMFGILVLCTLAYIIICPYIFNFLFPRYPEAIFLSQLAALSFPAFVLYIPNAFLHSIVAEKALYKLHLVTSVLQVLLVICLTLAYGVVGAIIARILYRYLFTAMTFYQLAKD